MKGKNLLLVVGLGALFWYFTRKGKLPPVPEEMLAKASLPLPTDTMAAGTLGPATEGVIKEGQTLACIGCGCTGGC